MLKKLSPASPQAADLAQKSQSITLIAKSRIDTSVHYFDIDSVSLSLRQLSVASVNEKNITRPAETFMLTYV